MDDNEAAAILRSAKLDPTEVYNSYKKEPSTGRKVADAVAGFGTSALQAIAYTGRAYAAGLGYVAKGVEKAITPIVEGLGGTVARANVPLPSVKDSSYFKKLGEDAGVNETTAGRVGSVVGDIAGSFVQPLPASPVGAAILGGATYAAGRAEAQDIPREALKGAAAGAVVGGAIKGVSAAGAAIGRGLQGLKSAPMEQSAQAVGNLIDEVAPSAGPSIYKGAVDTSKQILRDVGNSAERDALYKAVKPEIIKSKIHVTSPDSIDVIGGITKGFERSDDPLAIAYRNSPTGSVQQADKIVQFLNQKITSATQAGAKDDARILMTAKKDITNSLDKEFPGYAKARNMASDILEQVKQVQSGPIGKIAKTKEGDYGAITTKLFKPQDAATGVFQRTRDMLNEVDPELYNQLVRSGIQKVADSVPKSNSPLIDLVNGLTGTGAKARLWQEALNTPGLQLTKAKLEVLDHIVTQAKNPSMASKLASKIPGIGTGPDNVTSSKLLSFLNTTAKDEAFTNLVQRVGTDPAKLVPQTVKLIEASPIRKAVSVGATQAVNNVRTSNKDKK